MTNRISLEVEDIQTTGIRAVKIEPDVDIPISINQRQSSDLIYDIEELKDTKQIERVAGDEIVINYPVDSVSELDYLQYIESQFADINKIDADVESIDRTICELIPFYLNQEGIQLPSDLETAARAQCLILKQVRGFESDEKIVSYLKDKSYVTQLFGAGVDCIDVSPSTYTNVRDSYVDKQSVQNAIRRLNHMLYRNGIPLNELSDAGYTVGKSIPLGEKLPNQLRYQALVNWCNLLLEQLTDGISFHRDGEKYSVREIIAAIANLTLEKNKNKTKRRNIANLAYKDDHVTLGQIREIIYNNIGQENFLATKQELEHISTEMHRNLFQFAADELGFFSKPLDIAIDPTWYSIEKLLDHEKVSGAMGNIELEGESGFQFATAVSFGPMSRFSLGVNLVTDKSTLTDIYRRMILVMNEFTNIGWILADREFDDPETIEFARSEVGDTWIIRLRDHKKVIDQKEYESLKENGKERVSIGDIQANTFYKDISNSDFDWVFQKPEDDKLILMSGKSLTDENISHLSKIYPKRWSAETHIRQLKHDFSPQIPGRYAFDYLFFLNIASIFYNIHKIINQSLSPTYGLPLRPKYYEVLWGLSHSTFRSRCCSDLL